MKIKTTISEGYLDLLKTFAKANELDLTFNSNGQHVEIEYNDDSDTASKIMYMSIVHCGFLNMIYDYLKKCGVDMSVVSYGKIPPKRDMRELEKQWEERRKTIGLI